MLAEKRREKLRAACDTLLPPDEGAPREIADPLGRSASDRGIPEAVEAALPSSAPHVRAAVEAVLDGLPSTFATDDLAARTRALREAEGADPIRRLGLKQLKAQVFGLLVAAVDADGRNPDWEAIGFPGPATAPPSPAQAPKTIPLERVAGAEARLEADVCVVGSGAGGSVIAAELARAGRSVLVLEAGGYRNEADFRQLELLGLQELYLHGGLIWSADGSLGMIAGATLGGGTVVNSLVCLPTPDDVRAAWAAAGLEGLDGPAFDAHTERVWTRLGVNTEATHHNRNTELMIRGLEARGMAHERLPRNAALDDDPRFCGYCNAGCQQGCKQSTLKTYLQDAADHGARFVVDCHVERVRVAGGRAAGVDAVVQGPGGPTRLRVDAPTVVVAGGALESPALLLRSGIGGPAVGRHLRVHPTYMVSGVYDEPVEAWRGQIQSAVSFDRTRLEDGGGFLVETLSLSPAMWAGHSPWVDGAAHRRALRALPHTAAWHAVCHDHGAGRVTLGADGRPLVSWTLADPVDRRVAGVAHAEMAALHRAAGAREVSTFHLRERRWRAGEDFAAFAAGLQDAPAEEVTAYSAHQMGSCRMGADPATSVADGRGELHDIGGVWIGDASALPTAPGVNPMITIMALADRTAAQIAAA